MTESNHMIFRMAYRMAMADGEISANEALILHLFSSNMGLSREQLVELKASAETLDYGELPEMFPNREDQMALFEAACLMAMVDGKSDVEEWNMVMKLCEVFEIDRPQAQKSLAVARERLYKLAEQHNLLPEILANMEVEGDAE
ncbi:MAG: TerB family tellurite resistance protein [bacterium]